MNDADRCQLLQWIGVELMGWPLVKDDSYTATNDVKTHRLNNIVYIGSPYFMRFAPEATPYARTWYCFDPFNNPRDFQLVLERLTSLTGMVSFSDAFSNKYNAYMGSGLDVISSEGHTTFNEALMGLIVSLHKRCTSEDWNENLYIQALKADMKRLPPAKFKGRHNEKD